MKASASALKAIRDLKASRKKAPKEKARLRIVRVSNCQRIRDTVYAEAKHGPIKLRMIHRILTRHIGIKINYLYMCWTLMRDPRLVVSGGAIDLANRWEKP